MCSEVFGYYSIMYFDKNFKRIISTYLSLVESCDAQAIVTTVEETLNSKGLDLQKLCELRISGYVKIIIFFLGTYSGDSLFRTHS